VSSWTTSFFIVAHYSSLLGAGLAGYSHVTGGYAGGQAEYARVPNGASPAAFGSSGH